jgi:catechol 2,3-dioxygenase-like lactoylglutathione lyase family enzyme
MITAAPVKLAHVVLWSKEVPRMRDWYVKVLDARVVHETPGTVFLTYDEEHHRLALIDPEAAASALTEATGSADTLVRTGRSAPAEAPAHESPPTPERGLAHIAFTYGSLEDVLDTYERLKLDGDVPLLAVNHGPSTSMYYADPDGNQVELQVDNFATAEEGMAFMESESFARNPVGVPFDPDAFVKRLRAGEPAAAIVAPTW